MISSMQVLFLTAALISALVAVLIYLIFREDSDRSARLWITGSVMMTLGMTLLIFRVHVPDWLAYGVTNYVMLQAIVLYGYSVRALYLPDEPVSRIGLALCLLYGLTQWALNALIITDYLALIASISWTIAYLWIWISSIRLRRTFKDAPVHFFAALALFGALIWGGRIYLVTAFDINLSTDVKISNFLSLLLAHAVLMAQQISYLSMRLKDEKGKKQQIERLKDSNEKLWLEKQTLIAEKENSRNELLQDVHDGFGSKLISTQLLAERGMLDSAQFGECIKEMINDLHLIVDTLNHQYLKLDDAIIDFKHRVMRRQTKELPHINWQVDLEGLPEIEPRISLNLLRIVQEALSNALKHAHAENINIVILFDRANSVLSLLVSDDGVGWSDNHIAGQGINNMQQRARKVGAQFEMTTSGNGTTIFLKLPV